LCRGSEEDRVQVRDMLTGLESSGDWRGGVRLLEELDPVRAAKLSANDWYRLSRYLEVALAMRRNNVDVGSLTNERVPQLSGVDVRGFFVAEDREQLYRTIDARCGYMLRSGLLEEVTALLLDHRLPPEFVGAKSIGYRQTIRYLTADREACDVEAFSEYLK
jgi:tRNA dimethylallyltransferase